MFATAQESENWSRTLTRFPARSQKTSIGPVGFRQCGQGPAIILLHGIGSGSASWVYQLESLSSSYSVTAWDAPGYGDSALPLTDWPAAEDYAQPLQELLAALSVDRCVLVGHSLGALIAARYAVEHPDNVRGLLLADPAIGHGRLAEGERMRRFRERWDRFETLGTEAHAADRAPALLCPDPDPEHLALVRYVLARLRPDGYLGAARMLSHGDLLSDLHGLSVPSLVVCGSDDRITPPRDCRNVAEAIGGGCPFVEIDGAGHASYIDNPGRFCRIVRDFERSLA